MPNLSPNRTKRQLSELTIGEVRNLQRQGYVFAVGKYQIIPATFQGYLDFTGVNTNVFFNETEQEKIGDYLIAAKRPKVKRYVDGDAAVSLEEAQLELAKEFASIPVPYDVTRPPGAGGRNDPGARVTAGQSYYYGLAGNTIQASSERYQQALRTARETKSLDSLKQFIARGEGNYDSLNRGNAGDTQTYSDKYYQALSGQGQPDRQPDTGTRSVDTPSATTAPQADVQTRISEYIKRVYSIPLRPTQGILADAIDGIRVGANGRQDNYLKNATTNRLTQNEGIYDSSQLQGEFELLSGTDEAAAAAAATKSSFVQRVANFSPSEQLFLLTNNYIEFNPDRMRSFMSANAGNGINSNYSHAWRSPGKLAITANITIPGASGFRIGQIFWIGRTYESYKKFGAFQLFGLTETIDLNRGWTTELYARYNAIPISKIQGLRSK